MSTALVEAEFGRQPKSFVKAREPRLVVLVRVFLPSEAIRQFLHRLIFNVADIVQWLHHPYALHEAVVEPILENIGGGERRERSRAELPMDILELAQVGRVIVPLQRL